MFRVDSHSRNAGDHLSNEYIHDINILYEKISKQFVTFVDLKELKRGNQKTPKD